jgi:hypothetical protein
VARLSERLRIPVGARRCRLGATGRGGSPVGAAADPYRRKIARQLNKGENLRALRRDLFYASEGAIRHHNPEQQTEQAWGLEQQWNGQWR